MSDVEEPGSRYIGIGKFLRLYSERAAEVETKRRELQVSFALRDGVCEFCDSQPIAWSHNYDSDVILPRHSHIHWYVCDACEQLYQAKQDRELLQRASSFRSDATLDTEAVRLATFRSADQGHFSIAI